LVIGIWLLSHMSSYMLLLISWLRKRFFTLVTGIWLLASPLYEFSYAPSDFLIKEKIFPIGHRNMVSPCIHCYVLLQISWLRKRFFTLATGIWFLPCMSSCAP
jgi:hypothetical protein